MSLQTDFQSFWDCFDSEHKKNKDFEKLVRVIYISGYIAACARYNNQDDNLESELRKEGFIK